MLEFNATFIIAMFSFIIFMLIMNAILYKPLSRIQRVRENVISHEYNEVKLTEEKTEQLRQQQERSINMSKLMARENYNNKVYEYKLKRDAIINGAKNMAKKDLEISNTKLEGDAREAKIILEPKIKELANIITTKILGHETEKEDMKN